VVTHLFGQGFPKSHNLEKAGAKEWQGWGTALKPAAEFWILARKPISEKTVAKNVMKHGTGGLNIDGSRIEAQNRRSPQGADGLVHRTTGNSYGAHRNSTFDLNQGRFPANLVLSHTEHCSDDQCDIECAIKALDEQSLSGGMHSAGGSRKAGNAKQAHADSLFLGDKGSPNNGVRFGDSGGASRFFYCAKISRSERGKDNTHPTVKPIKLMSYLIKLITPPKGIVLDPFMGSGSTGVAALKEGFRFVGIEQNPEYVEIAKKRLNA
jgi:site-specific DNA-methyltransferase (adenine-specific)